MILSAQTTARRALSLLALLTTPTRRHACEARRVEHIADRECHAVSAGGPKQPYDVDRVATKRHKISVCTPALSRPARAPTANTAVFPLPLAACWLPPATLRWWCISAPAVSQRPDARARSARHSVVPGNGSALRL